MTRALLKHEAPTVSLSLTVNINADKSFLFIVGLVWLICSAARLGSETISQNLSGNTEMVLDWCEKRYEDFERCINIFCRLAFAL